MLFCRFFDYVWWVQRTRLNFEAVMGKINKCIEAKWNVLNIYQPINRFTQYHKLEIKNMRHCLKLKCGRHWEHWFVQRVKTHIPHAKSHADWAAALCESDGSRDECTRGHNGHGFSPYHHLVPLCYLFLPSLLQPPPSLPWNMTRTRTLRSTLSPGTNIFQKRAWLNTVLSELDSNLLLGWPSQHPGGP